MRNTTAKIKGIYNYPYYLLVLSPRFLSDCPIIYVNNVVYWKDWMWTFLLVLDEAPTYSSHFGCVSLYQPSNHTNNSILKAKCVAGLGWFTVIFASFSALELYSTQLKCNVLIENHGRQVQLKSLYCHKLVKTDIGRSFFLSSPDLSSSTISTADGGLHLERWQKCLHFIKYNVKRNI